MSRASVSTWALHSLLGKVYPGRPGRPLDTLMPSREGTLDLLDVPGELAKRGFKTMELCHFHVPSTSDLYAEQLRDALEGAGVELWSLLIDDGSINSPRTADRDLAWTEDWVRFAGAIGSKCVRVVAGHEPSSPDSVAMAAEQLLRLADTAEPAGVQVLTENWHDTLDHPAAVHSLFSMTGKRVGLCFDFGNWGGLTKYEDLASIATYATSCHAKCQFVEGVPDVEDFDRCLAITQDADFDGPYTLVYGEYGKVWDSLETQRSHLP